MSDSPADNSSSRTWLGTLFQAPRPEPMPKEPVLASYQEEGKPSGQAMEEYEIALKEFEAEVERRKGFHDDASKTIRRVFYSLLGTCLFCVLTLAGTPDADLISAGAVVTLPILNYPIGFTDFLVVGPLLLIALTVYLHIFVAEHRMIAIPPKHRLPMLPNFDANAARLTVWFVYYWLVPAALVYFVWKASPRAFEGPLVFVGSIFVVAVLAVLQIRRCPIGWRKWAVPILIASILVYSAGLNRSATLRDLNLFKAELQGQDLRGANLLRAYLAQAKLNGADLSGANLSNADLSGANLSGANLSNADLIAADLSGANLSGANLSGADLSGVDLSARNLSGIDMRGAHLGDADLSEADLSDADLSEAFLIDGADLRGANLRGADLRGADLRDTDGLSQTSLDQACGDTETKLPEGLTVATCEPDESEPKD